MTEKSYRRSLIQGLKNLGGLLAVAMLLYLLPMTEKGVRGLSDSAFLVALLSLLYHIARLVGCLHLFDRTAESFRKFFQMYKNRSPGDESHTESSPRKDRHPPDLFLFLADGIMLLSSALLAAL